MTLNNKIQTAKRRIDYSLLISVLSIFIALYLLYSDHLKKFSVTIELGSRVSIVSDLGMHIIAVPIILINHGAQGGVVKKFYLSVKQNGQILGPKAITSMQVKDVLKVSETQDAISLIYIKGKETFLFNLGRYIEHLNPGKIECDLIVFSSNGKRLEKTFLLEITQDEFNHIKAPGNVTRPELVELNK